MIDDGATVAARPVYRVVGVIHLPPLPGSARGPSAREMAAILDRVRHDAVAWASGGADALIVENFGDVPFRKGRVGPETIAAMTLGASVAIEESGLPVGVNVLRNDPPDRYVFNYRASYVEETDAVVRYLVKMRKIPLKQIAVFAQQDSYGDAGFLGVAKAFRAMGANDAGILRLGYKRNTVDVDEAVNTLKAQKTPIRAVVMVGTYRACAKFIEKTKDLVPGITYTNVSFVGSTALADELMLLGPKYATGVIVTQVVPAVSGYSSIVLEYKNALAKYFPGEAADYVSLEGYVAASVLIHGLRKAGPHFDTEKLVVAKTIAVGPRPRSTGFLPDGSRAYVSAENDGSVYVIDNVKRTLLKRLPLSGTGARPMGIDTSPDGTFVFVTTGRGRTLVILDAATNKEVGAVDVGDRPWGLAVAPDGRTVFTANGPSNDVSFVDVERRAVTARVPTGDRPWGVAVVR